MGVLFVHHYGYWVLIIQAFCFLLVGVNHRFLPFGIFADFGSMFLGGHLVRGMGDLSFGPFGWGSSFLIEWA